jgi:hypothetical protein
MSLIPCPGCSLPRTANDAEFECPICGFVPGADEEAELAIAETPPVPLALAHRPVPAPPPPVERRDSPFLPWALAGVGFGGTLVCAVGWYLAVLDRSAFSPDTVKTPPAATGQLAREVAPTPRRVSDAAPGPAPTPAVPPVAEKPNPWVVVRPQKAPPVVAPPVNDAPFEVIRVDRPLEDFRLDPVDGKKRIKLVGVANKLFIASVSGGAVVDASELDTGWVNVTGRIDDGATVRIAAGTGLVNFTQGIGGGATVEVAANTVTFAKRGKPKRKLDEQPNISGGARVTITGRQVTFLAPIVGDGTLVDVTLTTRGHLRFLEMDDGAKMVYRAAKATDVPLIVNPGLVKGDAECKRED